MTGELYRWLLVASLRFCLVLPLVLALAYVSRRSASRIVCVLLAVGLLAGLAAPALPMVFRITIPALASTRAFAPEVPGELRVSAVSSMPVAGSIPGANRDPLPGLIVQVWAAGAFLFLLFRGAQYCSSLVRFAKAKPVHPDHPAARLLEKLTEGMRRRPWMFEVETLPGPVVHGLLHPRLLVSSEFLARDEASQEMILRHEMEHLHGHDVPLRAALELAAIVFWFHPLVHLLLRQYDRAVEMACDDAVIAGGVPASKYGEVLVNEAKGGRLSRRHLREVRSRLLAVLRSDKRRSLPNPLTVVSLVLVFLLALAPLAVTGITPYPKQPAFRPLTPDPRLGALWRMRVGSGDIVDDWSGHGHHGRINGASWVTDPERGPCLSFDGVNDILILPAALSDWTTGPLTVAMWLKLPATADGGGLLLRGDYNQTWSAASAHMGNGVFRVFGERELSLTAQHGPDGGPSRSSPGLYPTFDSFGISEEQSSVGLPVDKWVHVAFSVFFDGTSMRQIRFYVNGEPTGVQDQDLNTAPAFNFDWPSESWYFGRGEAPPAHGNHFEGLLSDLAVFNLVLTEDQVRRVMGGDFSLPPAGQ
ncbi:hypothetical protein OKA04_22055 [Luteolibacter flavescens]|uniref:LamG-like jellyroll fold domain-containing protein n=1 Tax=Luteolibacter flavescens TaxID=1859460 RepID=A0ABT3FW29_9BACT|nr:M56 family metallopeptidase [Luteolibacter flavescens]MCW1887436.1 hypothetical protein [Luteolibacter flavescens]